jgi:hypothetical protein
LLGGRGHRDRIIGSGGTEWPGRTLSLPAPRRNPIAEPPADGTDFPLAAAQRRPMVVAELGQHPADHRVASRDGFWHGAPPCSAAAGRFSRYRTDEGT